MNDSNKKSGIDRIRDHSLAIEEQIRESQRRKEQQQFLDELGKRISIAREGRTFVEKGKYTDALQNFRRFLQITARASDVEIEDLRPDLFEKKNRESESLLVCSTLFDLIRILDPLDNPAANAERQLYHKLYIRFALGQKYQTFAAENIRKQIYYKGVKHKSEYLNTYNSVKYQKFCIVANWVFENKDPITLRNLRILRNKISHYIIGKKFIQFYYDKGPLILLIIRRLPFAKLILQKTLKQVAKRVSE
ncbi:MAG: hypothetical protein M9962_05035 [Oligoflexia bacterium]|nr:hypothetical protein [Oligoflexia bacterium]